MQLQKNVLRHFHQDECERSLTPWAGLGLWSAALHIPALLQVHPNAIQLPPKGKLPPLLASQGFYFCCVCMLLILKQVVCPICDWQISGDLPAHLLQGIYVYVYVWSFSFQVSVPLCSPGSPGSCIIDWAGLCFPSCRIKGVGLHAWLTRVLKDSFLVPLSWCMFLTHRVCIQSLYLRNLYQLLAWAL